MYICAKYLKLLKLGGSYIGYLSYYSIYFFEIFYN